LIAKPKNQCFITGSLSSTTPSLLGLAEQLNNRLKSAFFLRNEQEISPFRAGIRKFFVILQGIKLSKKNE
jgi:uncharacterized protein YbaP (TraB family)